MPDIADEAPAPLDGRAFASLALALGPYERRPHVAVACSGGADSMALTLLLRDWVRSVDGRLTALTVDHRLRPGSTAEARRVGGWLRRRKVEHVILTRPDTPLDGNLQAAARKARYALMTGWCAAQGALHLFLAHHREDQAETLLLRLARGSGVDGLAAMAPVTETPALRLLRPLLDVPRARLAATLAAAGQAHVEDPSNANAAFGRVRLRQASALLDREGLTAARLAGTARRMAQARTALEAATARLLAEAIVLYPEGYATLAIAPFRAASAEIALRALARLVTTVAGSDYPPRLERVERLLADVLSTGDEGGSQGGGRTLGGCRILPWKGLLLVCREPRAAAEVAIVAGEELLWDGRFRLRLDGNARGEVRRLGRGGWAGLVARCPELRSTRVPAPVRASLPSLWYLDDLVSVPHFSYVRCGASAKIEQSVVRDVIFAPKRPLTGAGFVSGQAVSESLTLGAAL
jgi:tRNA(Ile)-lysidine synthase